MSRAFLGMSTASSIRTRTKFLKDKSRVDEIIVKKQPYQLLNTSREFFVKEKSRVDKIIVKKQPYQLLSTGREFFLKDKSRVDKLLLKSNLTDC